MKKVPVSNGKYFALVSDCDYDLVMQYKWYARIDINTIYTISSNKRADGRHQTISMHRLIMNAQKGQYVDHIDGNGMNNCRENLRICTCSENQYNSFKRANASSKYKGVGWHKASNSYQARIQVENKRIHIGCFSTEKEAAIARNEAAIKYHGKFARLNIID
jgi:hypothetical protein